MKKKLIAILLTLTLVMTFMPAMVFAAGDDGSSWKLKRGISDLGDIFFYSTDYPADLHVWVEVKEGSGLNNPVFNYSLFKKGSDKILKSGTLALDENGDYSKEFEVSSAGTYICEVTLNKDKNTAQRVSFKVECDTPVSKGDVIKVSAGTLKVLSADSMTAIFTKAKNKKSITIPATVELNGQTLKVTTIGASAFKGSKIKTVTVGKNVKKIKKNAFKSSKATKIIVKTKALKKAAVKGSLKGSKVKTVQVKVGSKSQNKKYVKNYKKIFTKSNAGKKVTVK